MCLDGLPLLSEPHPSRCVLARVLSFTVHCVTLVALPPCTPPPGGKSPNIVFKDAGDLKAAIKGAANAIFFNHGQCCCAGSRLFVERDIFDEVVNGVADIAKSIKVGPGLEPDTQMGPLVSQDQLNTVTQYMTQVPCLTCFPRLSHPPHPHGCKASSGAFPALCIVVIACRAHCAAVASLPVQGKKDGACFVAGGGRLGEKGYFVQPSVIKDVRPGMSVVDEEIFGPVVVAEPFDNVDDLVKRANNSVYGLAAGVWSRDIGKALSVSSRLRAGTVWVNTYNIFDAALPFGGYKQSGWGREMGPEAIDLYTEVKSTVIGL